MYAWKWQLGRPQNTSFSSDQTVDLTNLTPYPAKYINAKLKQIGVDPGGLKQVGVDPYAAFRDKGVLAW